MVSKAITSALFGTASFLAFTIASPAAAQDQRNQARANFQRADVDKDDRLDLAEFTTFINLNADQGLGRAPTIRRLGGHATAFKRLDTNRDGFVSREELAAQAQQ